MGRAGHRRKHLLIVGQWWSCPRGITIGAPIIRTAEYEEEYHPGLRHTLLEAHLLSLGCRKIKSRPKNVPMSRL